ncbi:MAG: peptidase M61, partial [Bacteroidetes bacterium]|nr:peptidase M61 [Bacteroidota bacterium]
LLFILRSFSSLADNQYHFSVDLTKCEKDKLLIELIAPDVNASEVVYRLPKIVPGTYEILNFGRFVSEFRATDSAGVELKIERIDVNGWKIFKADKLYKITYEVEDSWDTEIKEPYVFEPAGSNFETGRNFILNTHCLFGYLENMTRLSYKISVTHPAEFYGSCSLTDVVYKDNVDVYTVSDYMQLQDAPMMYAVPDTTVLNIGGAQILISVYSQNKITTSKFIAENISEILLAQQEYLGGNLPIRKYAYLIYLTPNSGLSGASGALEHSYSSVYFLPEMEQKYLAQTIRDVSAHEFFHIVTPLNIHAEQIGNFNYNDPEMSKHLWLYEGTTEYASGLVQIKYGNMNVKEFLKVIESKIAGAKNYNDSIPFTVMSAGCLKKYKDQYGNVYLKGSLIGMCLDIKLRSLSQGKYGLQELMSELSKTYGKDKSFKDDELFAQIVKLTYPEIGDFFKSYVEGNETLPVSEMLELVGIGYGTSSKEKQLTMGGISIGLNPATNHLMIVNTASMDDFGKAMGYQEYDELLKFNGQKVTLQNAQEVIGSFVSNVKEGDELKVVVGRKKSENSKARKIKLHSKVFAVTPQQRNDLMLRTDATEQQLQLRTAWIGKH